MTLIIDDKIQETTEEEQTKGIEIPIGYKMTELGLIPDDWEIQLLKDLVHYINGKAHENLIKNNGRFIVVNSKFISTEGGVRKYSDYCYVPASLGEILMVMSDVPNGKAIAKCFFVDKDNCYTVNQRICVLHPKQINAKLLFYKLNRNPFYLAFDDGAKQTNLRKNEVLQCPISIPKSIKEQSNIAAALSDIDSLINSLDQLIAKKRNIKLATMQQLLTGKQRLPGFSEDWKLKRIGDIFEFLSTANNPRSDLADHGEIGYIHYGDIHGSSSSFFNCSKKSMPYIDQIKVKDLPYLEVGDLVIADASEDYEGIGKSIEILQLNNKKIVAGLHTFLLRGNKSVIADGFKGYLQYMPSFRRDIVRLATGISVYGISKNNLRDIQVKLPSINEQVAIARVLYDMDIEISSIEQQIVKARNLKQGMMQELLTGRIRLT